MQHVWVLTEGAKFQEFSFAVFPNRHNWKVFLTLGNVIKFWDSLLLQIMDWSKLRFLSFSPGPKSWNWDQLQSYALVIVSKWIFEFGNIPQPTPIYPNLHQCTATSPGNHTHGWKSKRVRRKTEWRWSILRKRRRAELCDSSATAKDCRRIVQE